MPMASALMFAATLSLTLQFLIFVYLYSFHRARFWSISRIGSPFASVRALSREALSSIRARRPWASGS